MKQSDFNYQLTITAPPHCAETVKECLGSDYYNPDFGRDIHARDDLSYLFRDAISNTFSLQMKCMTDKNKNKLHEKNECVFCNRLDKRREFYEELEKNIKLISEVEKDPT